MLQAYETPAVTINILPDDIFRELFTFCPSESCPDRQDWHPEAIEQATAWQSLVQVCQRWRDIIYGSPNYLDLQIHCSDKTPFRKNFSRWPEFPLTLQYTIYPKDDDDDVVFALEHPDRVRRVDLRIGRSLPPSSSSFKDSIVVDEVLEAMQVPFPALTYLSLTGPDPEDDEEEAFGLPSDFFGRVCSMPTAYPLACDFLSSVSKASVVDSWPCLSRTR